LEHGNKHWNSSQLIAEYVLSELPEDDLIQSEIVLKLIHAYKNLFDAKHGVDKSFFVYHTDAGLSTLAVSLLNFPYEESPRWKTDFSHSTGYQKKLFEQDYKDFLKIISKENKDELSRFLKMQKDTTSEEVESAISYLKLRKIKRLLLQNQEDLEKADLANRSNLILTHQHLKQMEIELTKKLGTVVIR
jgi:DNA primase